MSQIALTVSGMTCASCVRHVEKAILKVPGVSSASVNLATESAQIVSESTVDPSLLIQSLADAGYEAKLKDNAEENLKKKP